MGGLSPAALVAALRLETGPTALVLREQLAGVHVQGLRQMPNRGRARVARHAPLYAADVVPVYSGLIGQLVAAPEPPEP